MDVRLSGSAMERHGGSQYWKAKLPIEVTPAGTTTWPFASGVYRQPAATPPSASRTYIVANISRVVRVRQDHAHLAPGGGCPSKGTANPTPKDVHKLLGVRGPTPKDVYTLLGHSGEIWEF